MKINKRIEIVSSTIVGLSSMGETSRDGAKAALEKYFESVEITIVNCLADLQALVARKPDLVFLGMAYIPVNPSIGREDPEKIWISDYLDQRDIAYTGSDGPANMLERAKHLAKARVQASGIATSPFYVARQSRALHPDDINLIYPLFVKPDNHGGGVGIDSNSLVHNFAQLQAKVHSITMNFHSNSIIEQYLPGREFSVAILRKAYTNDYSVMPLELIAPPDQNGVRILSSKIKSLDQESFVEVTDSDLRSKVSSLALDVFHILGARDYGRIDIRMDDNGKAHFLEANLLPSLMDGYGNFPKACWLNSQLDYESMLLTISKMALTRATPHYASDYITTPIINNKRRIFEPVLEIS
jgi:D-alanine-D-alanine ligase